jgi:RNA polymerase sigma-70 factor (ECF subfamily)
VREIVERYMDAMGRGDIDAIVDMLTADATWAMPPWPSWYQGHEQIAAFLEREPLQLRWRHVPTRANGQPAVACYAWDDERACFVAQAMDVLTLRGTRIAAVTGFVDPVHVERFGLPSVLPVDR